MCFISEGSRDKRYDSEFLISGSTSPVGKWPTSVTYAVMVVHFLCLRSSQVMLGQKDFKESFPEAMKGFSR